MRVFSAGSLNFVTFHWNLWDGVELNIDSKHGLTNVVKYIHKLQYYLAFNLNLYEDYHFSC